MTITFCPSSTFYNLHNRNFIPNNLNGSGLFNPNHNTLLLVPVQHVEVFHVHWLEEKKISCYLKHIYPLVKLK
jgi:hypothetical protein